MGFLNVFTKILKIGESVAPAAITAVNPAAGAITSLVVSAVIKAEQAGGSGPEKKQQVMQQVTPMIGPMVSTIMQAAGSKVNVDPAGVNNAISQMVDGVVALMNALQPAQATATTGAAAGEQGG